MLVDPFGDKLKAGDSPKADQGRVLFLVEVSDPSEAKEFAYTVNGVLVSDFYTPSFFDRDHCERGPILLCRRHQEAAPSVARGRSELEGRDHRHLVAGDLVFRVGIPIQEPGQATTSAADPRGDRPYHGEGQQRPWPAAVIGPSGRASPRPAWHVQPTSGPRGSGQKSQHRRGRARLHLLAEVAGARFLVIERCDSQAKSRQPYPIAAVDPCSSPIRARQCSRLGCLRLGVRAAADGAGMADDTAEARIARGKQIRHEKELFSHRDGLEGLTTWLRHTGFSSTCRFLPSESLITPSRTSLGVELRRLVAQRPRR